MAMFVVNLIEKVEKITSLHISREAKLSVVA
jgi:hypothetical protein